MRSFVSSSFEDLKEHRAAAIRVLRQLGHEVLAMEDLVAAASTPLNKVLEMVGRSDAYVGLFGWRYGYVPGAGSKRKANNTDNDQLRRPRILPVEQKSHDRDFALQCAEILEVRNRRLTVRDQVGRGYG